jgi:hypothetical protein
MRGGFSNEIAALFRKEAGALQNDPALVGAWSFDQAENGAFISKVNPRLRAKIVGQADSVETPAGKALRLDGRGYLEVAPDSALDLTEACTLEAWIRPEQLPQGGGRIIDKSQVGTSNGYLLDTFPGNSLRLISQVGTLSHAARLVPGQWVHVAATVSPDGRLALYLQGEQVAQHPGAAMPEIGKRLAADARLRKFHGLLVKKGLGDTYEAAHARLAIDCLATAHARLGGLEQGKLKPLANPGSQGAADQSYLDATGKLTDGLTAILAAYEKSAEPQKQGIARLWQQAGEGALLRSANGSQ